jgi:hypothetical protein
VSKIKDAAGTPMLRGCPEVAAGAPMKELPALAILAWLCAGAPGHSGTCCIYSDGQYTVQSCENGSSTVTDRRGRKSVFMASQMQGRYPGQDWRPALNASDCYPACYPYV